MVQPGLQLALGRQMWDVIRQWGMVDWHFAIYNRLGVTYMRDESKAVEEVAKATGKAIDATRELGGFISKYVGALLSKRWESWRTGSSICDGSARFD